MDTATLETLCVTWQKILRLQDWSITVRLVERSELPDASGHADFLANNKRALIKVIKEEKYDEDICMEPYDGELILVHEMLHIQFNDVDKEGSPAYEAAIDLTASALVALRRANARG